MPTFGDGTSPGQTGSTNFFNSPLFGGILAGLGGLATGLLGNAAANTQANAATNSAHESNQLLAAIYGQNRADQMPFTQAGYGAIGRLQDYFGLNPNRYANPSASSTGSVPISGYAGRMPANGLPPSPMNDPNPGIVYIAGVPYPADQNIDSLDSFGGQNTGLTFGDVGTPIPTVTQGGGGTQDVAANGGQLPADFGSMNHDFSLADFNADPGYDFTKSEGQKAIDRSAAARGSVLGGGTIKAQTRYADNLASTHFNDAFNRYQVNRTNKINPLFTLAGYGLQSANQVANSGTQLGGQAANINFQGGLDAGQARASGYASTANAINNGISNIYSLSRYGRV